MQRRMSVSCIIAWHAAAGPDLSSDHSVPSWPCSIGQQHSRSMHGSAGISQKLPRCSSVSQVRWLRNELELLHAVLLTYGFYCRVNFYLIMSLWRARLRRHCQVTKSSSELVNEGCARDWPHELAEARSGLCKPLQHCRVHG